MRQTKIITRQRFTLRYFHTETSLDVPNILFDKRIIFFIIIIFFIFFIYYFIYLFYYYYFIIL